MNQVQLENEKTLCGHLDQDDTGLFTSFERASSRLPLSLHSLGGCTESHFLTFKASSDVFENSELSFEDC